MALIRDESTIRRATNRLRELLAGDRDQQERSGRDGRTHPTFGRGHEWEEARELLDVLTPEERQAITWEFNRSAK